MIIHSLNEGVGHTEPFLDSIDGNMSTALSAHQIKRVTIA